MSTQEELGSQPLWLPDADAWLSRIYDVIIIGGGMSGVSLAYWLQKVGLSSVILEERAEIASAATGRNGGHLVPGSFEFASSITTNGLDNVLEIHDFEIHCLQLISAEAEKNQIKCGIALTGHVRLAKTRDDDDILQESASLLDQYKKSGTYWRKEIVEEMIHSKPGAFRGGLYQTYSGQWNPVQFVRGISKHTDVQMATNTQAIEVQKNGDGTLGVVTDGQVVTGRKVIHASNAWAGKVSEFLSGLITPVRGQVLVTESIPEIVWPVGFSTMTGADEYGLQLRLPTGPVVLGGCRSYASDQEWDVTDDTTINPAVSAALRDYLSLFPELAEYKVEREWTGIMGFTRDHMPIVGPIPNITDNYAFAGFSGHGAPVIFLAAKSMAETIAGKKPGVPIPVLYDPNRFA